MPHQFIARTGVIGSCGLWVAALFMPWYIASQASAYHRLLGAPSYLLFAVGWCVPAWGTIAWFANVTLAISAFKFLFSGQAQVRLALVGSLIAFSVLLPLPIYDFEIGRRDVSWISGPAIWTWIIASLLNVMTLAAYSVVQQRTGSSRKSNPVLYS